MNFLTIKEASEYLKVRTGTLYSWAEKGIIPAYKFGRLIRFKRDDLEAWTEGQKIENSPTASLKSTITGDIRSIINNASRSVIMSHKGKARTASGKGGE